MKTLRYKGFIGTIEADLNSGLLHGKLSGTSDLITYEAENVKQLVEEFHSAVDDYLETCAELGKEPVKPYSGVLQIRIKPKLHQEAAFIAKSKGISLNNLIAETLEKHVDG
ncbi:type II toxin-antitoxin system HicB family antitoxin [Reichenbachiella sp.]|uniref:type II toxin-antitoxin system HicB family antitoxin n=1 Tax=Reichenbachiella sp. TaxID=2184521 RepID=UPI003B5901D8